MKIFGFTNTSGIKAVKMDRQMVLILQNQLSSIISMVDKVSDKNYAHGKMAISWLQVSL